MDTLCKSPLANSNPFISQPSQQEFIRIWSELRVSVDLLDIELKQVGVETEFTADIRGFIDQLCELIGSHPSTHGRRIV